MRQARLLPRVDSIALKRSCEQEPRSSCPPETLGFIPDLLKIRKVPAKGPLPACRCCGFAIPRGHPALTLRYAWEGEPYAIPIWVHLESCTPGAAHDLIVGKPSQDIQGETLDEIEQRIFLSSVQGV